MKFQIWIDSKIPDNIYQQVDIKSENTTSKMIWTHCVIVTKWFSYLSLKYNWEENKQTEVLSINNKKNLQKWAIYHYLGDLYCVPVLPWALQLANSLSAIIPTGKEVQIVYRLCLRKHIPKWNRKRNKQTYLLLRPLK